MKQRIRRYTLLTLLLLLSAGWVFLMSLDFSQERPAPAADGVEATITWLDWQGTGFPRVEAHISVVDQQGDPVQGLTQDAFVITEDDFSVPIQSFLGSGEQAVTSMLVIDRSGSMSGGKMTGARNAANAFVEQMRPERDRAGVIAFDNRVDRLQPLTNNKIVLRSAIDGIRANGGTALYDAIYQGLEELQAEDGRRILLALTDGIDNASRRTPQEIIRLAQDEGITIYTIGLGQERMLFSDLDGSTLRQMAHATGGEYYQTPSAAELAEMYRRIATVVQNEYVLGYDSPSPNLDGTTRRVEITVTRDVGSVQARSSYAVSGLLASAFNATLFFPLFTGLLLFLLLLFFLPSWWQRWQRRRAAQAAYPPPVPAPPAPYPAWEQQPHRPADPAFPCANCGQPVLAGKRFCSRCGQPVTSQAAPPPPPLPPPPPPLPSAPAPAFCRHCGNQLRASTKFCGRCGQPL
jgi:VWFA-related protein